MPPPSFHLRTPTPWLSLHGIFRTFTHRGRGSTAAATNILEAFLREGPVPHRAGLRPIPRVGASDIADLVEHLAADFGIAPEDWLSQRVADRLIHTQATGRLRMLRDDLASELDTFDATRELLVADVTAELGTLAGVVTAATWMQKELVAASGARPLAFVAEEVAAAVRLGRESVPIRRLRYESPVEIGLLIVSGLTVAKVGLTTLVYMVKRIYGLDLEIRTHRIELEERHLEAVARVAELTRAGPPGYGRIADLPLNTFNALDAATLPGSPSRLEAEAIVLVDENTPTEADDVDTHSRPSVPGTG